VELPFKVANTLEGQDLRGLKVLDLCSGCGVIGFEFHFYQPTIRELHFLEIQREDYELSFQKNLKMVKDEKPSPTQFFIHWENYESLLRPESESQFDLLLANPPYFQKDQGKLSPSQFKNRCRFFLDSDFEKMIDVIVHVLKPGASAFILLRPLVEHRKNLFEILCSQVGGRGLAQVVDLIRGTQMVQIVKNRA
jgi:tRNA1(Val) A37 N6-methylase TrmN6